MCHRPGRPSAGTTIALLLAALCQGLPAQALPEDRDQPILINSDQLQRDEKQGFTRYEGNVRMNQGSLAIEADSITVWHDSEQANRIVAEGKPARMQQQPEAGKEPVQARANTIEYLKDKAHIKLRQQAYIEQDGSTITGDSIDYFIEKQLVRADSDKSSDSSRVQVVIPARAIQKDESSRGDTESQ